MVPNVCLVLSERKAGSRENMAPSETWTPCAGCATSFLEHLESGWMTTTRDAQGPHGLRDDSSHQFHKVQLPRKSPNTSPKAGQTLRKSADVEPYAETSARGRAVWLDCSHGAKLWLSVRPHPCLPGHWCIFFPEFVTCLMGWGRLF